MLKLVGTQSQELLQAAKSVAKVDAVEKSLAELAESLRVMETQAKQDTEKLNDELLNRIDALGNQHQADIASLGEKLKFISVKKETADDTTAEDVELLKGTVGTCLRRDDELQQAVDRLSTCFNAMQRDVGNLTAQVTPEVIVEVSPGFSGREPGKIPQCSCKRLRR